MEHGPAPILLPSTYASQGCLFVTVLLVKDLLVCARITPLQNALQLLVGPRVEVNRLDSANVRSHTTVDTRASVYIRLARGREEVAGDGAAYRMQMKMPKFQLAHRGSAESQNSCDSCPGQGLDVRLFLLQSAQLLLASSFTRLLSVWRFCSARSAAGLGRRDMVGWR